MADGRRPSRKHCEIRRPRKTWQLAESPHVGAEGREIEVAGVGVTCGSAGEESFAKLDVRTETVSQLAMGQDISCS